MIIIGFTEVTEVDPQYFTKLELKDLKTLKFVRCPVCKDVVKKRQHVLCAVKRLCRKLNPFK